MRPRELVSRLQDLSRALKAVSIEERPKQSGAFYIENLNDLRAVVLNVIEDDLPSVLRVRLKRFSGEKLFQTAVHGIPTSQEDSSRFANRVRSISEQVDMLIEVVQDLYQPASTHVLQILLPPSQTLSEFSEAVEGVLTFIDYPSVSALGQKPVLRSVEPGSVWLIVSFPGAQALLLTLGCLGILFGLMVGALKIAQAVKTLEAFGKRLDIGHEFLEEALRSIKSTDARPKLEALAREFAPEMGDAERNEWINYVLEISFTKYKVLIESGMEILYSARDLKSDFKQELPASFSLDAMQIAVAKQQPSLPPAQPQQELEKT